MKLKNFIDEISALSLITEFTLGSKEKYCKSQLVGL